MEREFCIFNSKKSCTSCGECENCDLNASKKCNNCGKCLEMQGYDMKAIKIDEIIEDNLETKELKIEADVNDEIGTSSDSNKYIEDFNNKEELYDEYIDGYVTESEGENDVWNDNIQYIDDIDGLKELLEDEDKVSELTSEEFPGFYKIRERN